MPRLSVNFDLTDRVSAYVGHGVFTGGYPNVWLSNTVSNDGVKGLQFNARNTNLLTDALCTNPVTGKTGPGMVFHVLCLIELQVVVLVFTVTT